jgi:hypothetical protein
MGQVFVRGRAMPNIQMHPDRCVLDALILLMGVKIRRRVNCLLFETWAERFTRSWRETVRWREWSTERVADGESSRRKEWSTERVVDG